MTNLELDNILKCEKLQNVMNVIEELIDNQKYSKAYYKVAAMLEFVNANLLMKYFKIKLNNTDISNMIELYASKDKELCKQMMSINAEYNNIDTNNIKKNDVIYLLLRVNDILEYIHNKYGEVV